MKNSNQTNYIWDIQHDLYKKGPTPPFAEFMSTELVKNIDVTQLISIFKIEIDPKKNNKPFVGEEHNFWEFVFIEKGSALIKYGKNQYIMKDGELAFHAPNLFHSINPLGDDILSYVIVSFICESISLTKFLDKIVKLNHYEHSNLYNALRLSNEIFSDFCELENNIFYMKPKQKSISASQLQMIKNHIELILLSIENRNFLESREDRINVFAKKTRNTVLCQKIKSYLEDNINKSLSLNLISEEVGYSVSQIQKIYKNETGTNIIDYFIELKIEKAKKLIKEGNSTFTQISAELGYLNSNYFSRIFKQKTGMSPTEFSNT